MVNGPISAMTARAEDPQHRHQTMVSKSRREAQTKEPAVSYQILGRWGCWLVVGGLWMAGSVFADPFEGLTWEQRWEIADSLDQSSHQAVQAGDYPSALQLIDGALAAHPSHYRSWMNRWNLQLCQGLEGDMSEEELAASILRDFSRVEEADVHEDQVYVLSFAAGKLFQLTGDSTHLQRRLERMSTHLAEHPENPRAFDFHLSVAKWTVPDASARSHFLAAQQQATTPGRRRAWSQAVIERGIASPDFLGEDDVRATLTQWHSTFSQLDQGEARLREEANLVLWHGQLANARQDTVVVAHLVNAYAGLRRKLSPHEEEILQRGWQAPVGPYAIMDSRADAMEGDLLMQQGDRERATARYQSAWERLAPLLAQWDRSRAVMSGEHLRSLRQRLLPHVTQP